jgi:hypothetical protein
MLLNSVRRSEPASLLEGILPLLESENWDDLVVGLLQATRAWLCAEECRFWQVDALSGGLRARWSINSSGLCEDRPGRVRPFLQPREDELEPPPSQLLRTDEGWLLELSCRARGGELGVLEVRGRGIPPEASIVSQWRELAGASLVRGRESMRERSQAGGVRKLSGAARELASIAAPDLFWRRVVELARESFGAERASVLLADPDPSILHGRWGTDFDGKTCDEGGWDVPVIELEARAGRPLDLIQSRVLLSDDFPRCGAGTSAMTGSVPLPALLVPVPGLPEGTCWLLCDWALSGRTADPAVHDLLDAYGTLVGQIAGRLRAERALASFVDPESGGGPDDSAPPRLAEILEQWEPERS